jgi:hypothetical protein
MKHRGALFFAMRRFFWIAPAVFENLQQPGPVPGPKYSAFVRSSRRYMQIFQYSDFPAAQTVDQQLRFRSLRRDLAFRQGHSANPVASLLLTGQV